jgi:HTH-type transcriptional regulator / antitoxin HipB
VHTKIISVADIGASVRKKRKESGLKLSDAAALCGVGYRFMSDLENGKETVRLDKVFRVLTGLGLDMHIDVRGWPA